MLKLKPKQQQVLDAVNDPSIQTIILIGTLGTGKTDIAAHVGISIAYQFPKTYWTVFRQNISTAKRSVIPSYLNMLDMMNFEERQDYKHNKQDQVIKFLHNNSEIAFIEADVTKDRQAKKIKGINATGNHIDEADELDQTMFITAVSRRGRRNQAGQPSISIVTMNPNDTYLRELYYNKYHDPEQYGPLPKGVIVIEFTEEDSWQTKEDLDALKSNPRGWVERYIYNNWNYQDDDNSLFKYRYFQAAVVKNFDPNATRYIGFDVARGKDGDRSVISLWAGNTLIDIFVVKDKQTKMTTDDQAMELIKYMTENSVLAQNVAVDAVGIGVGVVDHCKSKGIIVKEFVSGASPIRRKLPNGEMEESKYDNLRSQVIWKYADGLEKGTYKIFEGMPARNDLISEAMAHLHEVTDKKLSVESKDKVKERTGSLSPDIFDSVVMGLLPQLSIDPKNDITRVVY